MDANALPDGDQIIIRARNIRKRFGNLQVLKGVDLDVESGRVVSIVGPSGAGKTTLLQILGTLLRPDEPEHTRLSVDGHNVLDLNAKALARFRNRHIGFVFQFHYLLPEFTALENVALPAYIAGVPRADADRRAREMLARVGLAQRLHHRPAQLSGGEQQRVAVARALINRPRVVFADEPSGNLDSQNAEKLHGLFFDLQEDLGTTFVIVTHNKELAAMSHRIHTMRDGMIVE
jgi:lipoprotein-releasing system ATP-binding protein